MIHLLSHRKTLKNISSNKDKKSFFPPTVLLVVIFFILIYSECSCVFSHSNSPHLLLLRYFTCLIILFIIGRLIGHFLREE